MADAGNVSAAQNTRLLIEFPLGKVHIECCQILLSQKLLKWLIVLFIINFIFYIN